MINQHSKLPLRIGVGIVLLNNKNEVFIGRRIDNPKNFWQMPQGGVDKDENFLTAAKRELEEETSIKSVKLVKELIIQKIFGKCRKVVLIKMKIIMKLL